LADFLFNWVAEEPVEPPGEDCQPEDFIPTEEECKEAHGSLNVFSG